VRVLILKTFILLAPFALALGFVEYRLRRIPNSYSRAKASLEAELPSLELIVLGSSHAECAFDIAHLPIPSFNLAHGSQSLYYDAKLIEQYAPRAPNLQIVIFTFSYFSFESRLDRTIESWRSGFYRQVFGINPENGERAMALIDFSYIALYSPNTAYALVLKNLIHPGIDSDTGAERMNAAGGEGLTDEFGMRRVRFHDAGMSPEVAAYNKDVLKSACRMLKERGIRVDFVSTPVHATYFRHLNAAAYTRMQADAREVAQACGVEYRNYMTDARFDSEDFLNSDHLNARGAEKFSVIVSSEVIQAQAHPR
jgi:hypothetical protein